MKPKPLRKIITLAWLKREHACPIPRRAFKRRFGTRTTLTRAKLMEAARLRYTEGCFSYDTFPMSWLGRHLFAGTVAAKRWRDRCRYAWYQERFAKNIADLLELP